MEWLHGWKTTEKTHSHWQENRSMTGSSAGGGKHGEEVELNEGQIVTDFRTIQGFSFLLSYFLS